MVAAGRSHPGTRSLLQDKSPPVAAPVPAAAPGPQPANANAPSAAKQAAQVWQALCVVLQRLGFAVLIYGTLAC